MIRLWKETYVVNATAEYQSELTDFLEAAEQENNTKLLKSLLEPVSKY